MNPDKTYHLIDDACAHRLKGLEERFRLAEERFNRMADACWNYEEETEDSPTPEQEAHLERMLKVCRKAEMGVENLSERIHILKKIRSLHEEELSIARPSKVRV